MYQFNSASSEWEHKLEIPKEYNETGFARSMSLYDGENDFLRVVKNQVTMKCV